MKGRRQIRLKRVYEPPAPSDGTRILVERLWPRGLTKASAVVDFWCKEIAPSTQLRIWYGHDPEKWLEFRRRYNDELDQNATALETLVAEIGNSTATFVFAAKDENRNSAVLLRDYVEAFLRS